MSDATISFRIDPDTAHFCSPVSWKSSVAMGNFDPVLLAMTQPPGNPEIRIVITQPTGKPGRPSYVGGNIAVSAPQGLKVDIDFLVTSTLGASYYTCGVVFNVDSGPGAELTGSVDNSRHSCDRGRLTLHDITALNSSDNFFLLIQDPATGGIALVDPKITTGGS